MSRIEDVKNWMGDMLNGPGTKPELSFDETVEVHRAAVLARDAAETEATAADLVSSEKQAALGRAREVERRAAALLVEASAKGAGASRDVVVQDAPRRRTQIIGAHGDVIGYTTDAS